MNATNSRRPLRSSLLTCAVIRALELQNASNKILNHAPSCRLGARERSHLDIIYIAWCTTSDEIIAAAAVTPVSGDRLRKREKTHRRLLLTGHIYITSTYI